MVLEIILTLERVVADLENFSSTYGNSREVKSTALARPFKNKFSGRETAFRIKDSKVRGVT